MTTLTGDRRTMCVSAARRALALAVGLAVLLAACRAAPPAVPPPATQTPVPPPPADAQTALSDFYDWYLAYPGNPLVRRAYRANENLRPYLTDRFVARVDAALDVMGEQGIGYDPFVCAQDLPTALEYDLLVSGESASTVLVQRYYGSTAAPSNMVIDLIRADGRWQIDDISCSGGPVALRATAGPPPTISPTPSAEEMVAGDWQPFSSSVYGFSLRHPAAWMPYEMPNDSGYEGDPVTGYVEFGSSGSPPPVALVVSDAPLDEWRAVFPEPEGVQTLTFGDTRVQVEKHFENETYYVIEHPTDDARRVALRVMAGSDIPPGVLDEVIATMLSSFQFDE